jgi:hypothetical protein
MSWAIEEYVEDAIVKYLNNALPADMFDVKTAWTTAEIKYPCVVVRAGASQNVTEQFTGHRNMVVGVLVMTEAVPNGLLAARNANRVHRDAVIDALAQTALQDDVNALNPDGVAFSLAQMTGMDRSVEPEKRAFTTEITLEVIVSPKEI